MLASDGYRMLASDGDRVPDDEMTGAAGGYDAAQRFWDEFFSARWPAQLYLAT